MQLNVAEREDSSPLSSFEVIAEATSMPESDVVAPPSTKVLPTTPRGMPYSESVSNGSASYDMWRSSMTALLDMEAEEFEQMSSLASDLKNADHDLFEENQAPGNRTISLTQVNKKIYDCRFQKWRNLYRNETTRLRLISCHGYTNPLIAIIRF